jgi:ABC-type transporter MlaC component
LPTRDDIKEFFWEEKIQDLLEKTYQTCIINIMDKAIEMEKFKNEEEERIRTEIENLLPEDHNVDIDYLMKTTELPTLSKMGD